MTHNAQDVETMARLLCDTNDTNASPDDIRPHSGDPAWVAWRYRAINVLDALQAKGWKITSGTATQAQSEYCDPRGNLPHLHELARNEWHAMHDAAPIVPRSET